jgi:hypothetical protein
MLIKKIHLIGILSTIAKIPFKLRVLSVGSLKNGPASEAL